MPLTGIGDNRAMIAGGTWPNQTRWARSQTGRWRSTELRERRAKEKQAEY